MFDLIDRTFETGPYNPDNWNCIFSPPSKQWVHAGEIWLDKYVENNGYKKGPYVQIYHDRLGEPHIKIREKSENRPWFKQFLSYCIFGD